MKRIKFSQHNKTNYITCHKHKLKPILFDYIYHKNEKGKTCQIRCHSGHIKIVGSQPILFCCSLKNESNASITTLFIIVLLEDA